MPFLQIIKNDLKRKFSFNFSTPTEDISSSEAVFKYLNTSAGYSLIPGVQNTSLLDPESLLLQILPFTQNSMLDLSMPFIEITKKKNAIRHYGRYIICNKQLVGIKIKPSDYWPKSKTINQQISTKLQNFYKDQGIQNYSKQIVVGQFMIATRHFKIVPLFASQLSSTFENTTLNLLNDYYSAGCQIYSIVNDISEQKKKTLKNPLEILRNYRKESTIVIYSGMHLAVDPSEIYRTRSCAFQGPQRIKEIYVTKLDQTYTQSFIGDLDKTKYRRPLSIYQEPKVITSEFEVLDCRDLRIRFCFQSIQLDNISKFGQPMEAEVQHNQVQKRENEITLYLWNLLVNFNKRKPFVLPCPMNSKDEVLLKKIVKLSQQIGTKLSSLVLFLKLDPKAKIPKKYENHSLESISLQSLSENQSQQFCLYFCLNQRLSINNIEKNENFFQQTQKNIINCTACISEEVFKIFQSEAAVQPVLVPQEDDKFVQKFMKRTNAMSLESFYIQMAKYYPKTKLTIQFVTHLFESMKRKIRKQGAGTPFQRFILGSSFEEVRHIFVKTEQDYFFKNNPNIKAEEQSIQPEQLQNQENNFRTFIKKVKYHCNAQKKSNFVCHLCNSLFNKKEKFSFGRFCLGCSNFVCYSCFDTKTGQTAQSQENFQQCLICMNKCDCEKCIKKKMKSQGLKSQYPQKNFFSTPLTAFYDSCENIKINLEENINKKSIDDRNKLFLKTEFQEKKSTLFGNIKIDTSQAIQKDQTSIKACWTCQLANRVDRIISFQCSACKDIKCLSCEKTEIPNRSWVLRGRILCNVCYQGQNQVLRLRAEVKNLKGKIVTLEHEAAVFRRQKLKSSVMNNSQFRTPIIEEIYGYDAFETHQQHEEGGATPIFDRSANKANGSPTELGRKQNCSENGSIASFGGRNNQNVENEKKNRKNSSNSSGSRSKGSKRSAPVQKQTSSKRKYSIESQQQSLASFQNKPNKNMSNSSKCSIRSSPKTKKSSKNSVESGLYQQSSESEKNNFSKKPEWKKNYHQNYQLSRDQFSNRGRGRGRDGWKNNNYSQRDNQKGDNNFRGQRKFQQNRKIDQESSKRKWQNNSSPDEERQEEKFNNRGKFSEKEVRKESEKRFEKEGREQQKADDCEQDEERGNYYFGRIKSRSQAEEEDIDY